MDDLPKDYTVKQVILCESTYAIKRVTTQNGKVKIVTRMRPFIAWQQRMHSVVAPVVAAYAFAAVVLAVVAAFVVVASVAAVVFAAGSLITFAQDLSSYLFGLLPLFSLSPFPQ